MKKRVIKQGSKYKTKSWRRRRQNKYTVEKCGRRTTTKKSGTKRKRESNEKTRRGGL